MFILQYSITAKCDWKNRDGSRRCGASDEFRQDFDCTGKNPKVVEAEADAAAHKHFLDIGWDIGDDLDFRCPKCKGRTPDMPHWEDEE